MSESTRAISPTEAFALLRSKVQPMAFVNLAVLIASSPDFVRALLKHMVYGEKPQDR